MNYAYTMESYRDALEMEKHSIIAREECQGQAETEIDDSCPHCFGKGCRKCEAPERDQ